MVKVMPCQFLGLSFKKLPVSISFLLGFSLLEPSHHAVRKPEQRVERPCGEEHGPWLSVWAELPASSRFLLANHVSESSGPWVLLSSDELPSYHLVEQNLTFPTMSLPDWRAK